MAASYPTSVKSFSTKSTTDVVEASHPNDLQDEVTAIEDALLNGFTHDLKNTGWTDYSGTSTVTGWSAFTQKTIFYKKVGRLVFVSFQIAGTSDATTASFTLPHARTSEALTQTFAMSGDIQDNGAAVTTNAYGQIVASGSTATLYPSAASGNWTASSTKRVQGSFWYEAAS